MEVVSGGVQRRVLISYNGYCAVVSMVVQVDRAQFHRKLAACFDFSIKIYLLTELILHCYLRGYRTKYCALTA